MFDIKNPGSGWLNPFGDLGYHPPQYVFRKEGEPSLKEEIIRVCTAFYIQYFAFSQKVQYMPSDRMESQKAREKKIMKKISKVIQI